MTASSAIRQPVTPAAVKRLGLNARARLYALRPHDGRIIRLTGTGNLSGAYRYYLSSQHFLHNVPLFADLPMYHALVAQNYVTDEFLEFGGCKLFFSKEPLSLMTGRTLRAYRFHIALENSDHDGYITEKIIDAFVGGYQCPLPSLALS